MDILSPDKSKSLDISGVAGFFGSDVAVKAMKTVHLFDGRKWVGWYNSPGSYEIAKAYGQLAKSKFWNSLYPGHSHEPAILFELDGKDGPSYRGVHSGTVMPKTGHAAHLVVQACKAHPISVDVNGRRQASVPVSIVHLRKVPESMEEPHPIPQYTGSIVAFVPIFASLAAATACAGLRDWYCFAMVVLGMLAGGVSCLIIGDGKLVYTHPEPAKGAPPGDGLMDGGADTVVLLGEEGAVNAVTRGAFALRFGAAAPHSAQPIMQQPPDIERPRHAIGVCSLLLTIQFLAQLVLLPQGSFPGQAAFLASLAVSWGYNSYMCSICPWEAQRRILMEQVLGNPNITKFLLPTRTAMAVFVLLVLGATEKRPLNDDVLRDVLTGLLPNKTRVWDLWREAALQMIAEPQNMAPASVAEADMAVLSDDEKTLLRALLADADVAREAFHQHRRQWQRPLKELWLGHPERSVTRSYSDVDCEKAQRSSVESIRPLLYGPTGRGRVTAATSL